MTWKPSLACRQAVIEGRCGARSVWPRGSGDTRAMEGSPPKDPRPAAPDLARGVTRPCSHQSAAACWGGSAWSKL